MHEDRKEDKAKLDLKYMDIQLYLEKSINSIVQVSKSLSLDSLLKQLLFLFSFSIFSKTTDSLSELSLTLDYSLMISISS